VNRSIAPIVGAALLCAAATLGAQVVGYPPPRSPFVDLEHSQELTLIAGEYHAHRDPADVGPQSGPLFGVHYEWRAGGPAHLTAEFARASSDRRLINPFKPEGPARELGQTSRPLYTGDIGLGLSLTGGKSWHHIVPEIAAGTGLISDFHAQPDSGGFKFGTRFALTWGGGIRIVPGGKWQIRGDVKNRLYTIGYPQTYYVAPAGGTAVIPQSQAKSFWTNNPAFTLGLSYLF
jgi:hypothetical protein